MKQQDDFKSMIEYMKHDEEFEDVKEDKPVNKHHVSCKSKIKEIRNRIRNRKRKMPDYIYYKKMDKQFKQLKPRRADDIVDKCFRCQMKHTQGWKYDIDGKKYIICSYCYQQLKHKAMPVHLSYYPWRN